MVEECPACLRILEALEEPEEEENMWPIITILGIIPASIIVLFALSSLNSQKA